MLIYFETERIGGVWTTNQVLVALLMANHATDQGVYRPLRARGLGIHGKQFLPASLSGRQVPLPFCLN